MQPTRQQPKRRASKRLHIARPFPKRPCATRRSTANPRRALKTIHISAATAGVDAACYATLYLRRHRFRRELRGFGRSRFLYHGRLLADRKSAYRHSHDPPRRPRNPPRHHPHLHPSFTQPTTSSPPPLSIIPAAHHIITPTSIHHSSSPPRHHPPLSVIPAAHHVITPTSIRHSRVGGNLEAPSTNHSANAPSDLGGLGCLHEYVVGRRTGDSRLRGNDVLGAGMTCWVWDMTCWVWDMTCWAREWCAGCVGMT